jgi:hypothetical protein
MFMDLTLALLLAFGTLLVICFLHAQERRVCAMRQLDAQLFLELWRGGPPGPFPINCPACPGPSAGPPHEDFRCDS